MADTVASTIQVVVEEGRVRARRDGAAPPYDPMVNAIEAIGDPGPLVEAFDRWRQSGETPGFVDGSDVASIYFNPDGVVAEISLSSDDHEELMEFDAFEPVLRSWQRAWSARAESAR